MIYSPLQRNRKIKIYAPRAEWKLGETGDGKLGTDGTFPVVFRQVEAMENVPSVPEFHRANARTYISGSGLYRDLHSNRSG